MVVQAGQGVGVNEGEQALLAAAQRVGHLVEDGLEQADLVGPPPFKPLRPFPTAQGLGGPDDAAQWAGQAAGEEGAPSEGQQEGDGGGGQERQKAAVVERHRWPVGAQGEEAHTGAGVGVRQGGVEGEEAGAPKRHHGGRLRGRQAIGQRTGGAHDAALVEESHLCAERSTQVGHDGGVNGAISREGPPGVGADPHRLADGQHQPPPARDHPLPLSVADGGGDTGIAAQVRSGMGRVVRVCQHMAVEARHDDLVHGHLLVVVTRPFQHRRRVMGADGRAQGRLVGDQPRLAAQDGGSLAQELAQDASGRADVGADRPPHLARDEDSEGEQDDGHEADRRAGDEQEYLGAQAEAHQSHGAISAPVPGRVGPCAGRPSQPASARPRSRARHEGYRRRAARSACGTGPGRR